MIAKVHQSYSITDSFSYARAIGEEDKGGQLIRSNVLSEWMPFDTQLAFLKEHSSSKYKVKALVIILSHSIEDQEHLEKNERLKKKYIGDFLDECRRQGIDIDKAPWAIMEHHNTDCLHYHMLLLTSRFDGKRLNTAFIGKKAKRAAYLASKKNGLHYAKGAEKREMARQRYLSRNINIDNSQPSSDTEELKKKIQKNTIFIQQTINDNRRLDEKKRRQKANQERKVRLEKIKAQIEFDAIKSNTMRELIEKVENRGYKLLFQKKWYLLIPDKSGEKMLKYSLDKSIKVNMNLIHQLQRNEKYIKAKEMADVLQPGINEKQKIVAAHLYLGELNKAAEFVKTMGGAFNLPQSWNMDAVINGGDAALKMCVDIAIKLINFTPNINGGYGGGTGYVDTSKKNKSKEELIEEAKSKGYSF